MFVCVCVCVCVMHNVRCTAARHTRVSRLRALLRTVLDEQRVQVQRLGQLEVADVAAADGQAVQAHGVVSLRRHLGVLQVGVHADVHACAGERGAAVSLCGKCVVCCVPAVWAWRFVRVWMGGRVCERGEHGCRGVRADGVQ